MRRPSILTVVTFALVAPLAASVSAQSSAIDLWKRGQMAFGVFVPTDEQARTAAYVNPLYDFLFLNLEEQYDSAPIAAAVQGLRASTSAPRKTLIVRIPPIEPDGLEAAQERVRTAFELGADGVAVPHVRSVEQARHVLALFRAAKANVWSPSNPSGDRLAMLMIEDPEALVQAPEIASLPGYSILACGIGSLTQALGGNRDAAEAGNQKILAETKRVKLVNMLTARRQDVERRVKQGYLALLALGTEPDAVIKTGREATGRR